MKQTIVAFCGSKGSGKSTATDIFIERLKEMGIPVQEVALAARLKESCSRIFDKGLDYMYDPDLKEKDFDIPVALTTDALDQLYTEFGVEEVDYNTMVRPHVGRMLYNARNLLQYCGTEVLQTGDNLRLVRDALRRRDLNAVTVISDLRFEHEFHYIYSGAVTFIPVYVANKVAELQASADTHDSENGWQGFVGRCKNIDNNGSINDLTKQVHALSGELE